MKNKIIMAGVIIASCMTIISCSKKIPEPVHTPKPTKQVQREEQNKEQSEEQEIVERTSFEEPSEAVLKKFMFAAYKKMDDAGGVPMTVTASGKGGNVRLKLYDVRKTDCKLIDIPSVAPRGKFECTVNLQVKMWWDGQREPDHPSDDNKRIDVIQNDDGEWLDCSHEAKKNKDFCDVRGAKKRKKTK